MSHPELSLLLLLAVAAAVAVFSSRARLPYAIGLVVAGLVLGNLLPYTGPHLSKELLFLVVLPGLLFEAAYQIHFGALWQARALIFWLAVPGLILATFLTALLVWWGANYLQAGSIEFLGALVFGALISATDPVSVLAIFRTLGVDHRLSVVVEAESLFNDGTAIVLFTIVLGMAAGGDLNVASAAWEFVRVAALAVAVGAVFGVAVSLLTRTINDPIVEITLTVLIAYGAFVAAELLGLSGVIACVVAAMITGNWGAPRGMQVATRAAVDGFWSYAAFLLNSFVFLLVGLEINLERLTHYLPEILIGWLAITGARAALVYASCLGTRLLGRQALPWSWAAVLTWGGLRGALSMVLALSLPRDFSHRDMILHMTFGVVLITLLAQGLTIRPLLARIGLAKSGQ